MGEGETSKGKQMIDLYKSLLSQMCSLAIIEREILNADRQQSNSTGKTKSLDTPAGISSSNSNILVSWSYPRSYVNEQVLQRRSVLRMGLNGISGNVFFNNKLSKSTSPNKCLYSKYGSVWHYHMLFNENQPKEFEMIIMSYDFNPNKYFHYIQSVFAPEYSDNYQSPNVLVPKYIALFGKKQSLTKDNQSLFQDILHSQSIKYISDQFNLLDASIIYFAVLLRKRIIVYDENIGDILSFVGALPYLAFHKKDFSILKPFVLDFNDPIESADIKTSKVYIAGTNKSTIKAETDWYDILIDLSSRSIHVPEGVRDQFRPTKLHKEIAKCFAYENDNTDEQDEVSINEKLVTSISNKTKDILSRIESLKKDKNSLTLEDIKEVDLGDKNLEELLFNIYVSNK